MSFVVQNNQAEIWDDFIRVLSICITQYSFRIYILLVNSTLNSGLIIISFVFDASKGNITIYSNLDPNWNIFLTHICIERLGIYTPVVVVFQDGENIDTIK